MVTHLALSFSIYLSSRCFLPCPLRYFWDIYIDNLTLSGKASVVASDVKVIMTEAHSLSLALNIAKCEVISHDPHITLPDPTNCFTVTAPDNALLLSETLSLGEALRLALEAQVILLIG